VHQVAQKLSRSTFPAKSSSGDHCPRRIDKTERRGLLFCLVRVGSEWQHDEQQCYPCDGFQDELKKIAPASEISSTAGMSLDTSEAERAKGGETPCARPVCRTARKRNEDGYAKFTAFGLPDEKV